MSAHRCAGRAVLASLVLLSCTSRPEPRACATDADCAADSICRAGSCEVRPTVIVDVPAAPTEAAPANPAQSQAPLRAEIVMPAAEVHTNGRVLLAVSVEGEPDSVVIQKDGAPVATLAAPYAYEWDTAAEIEGLHTIGASVRRGTQEVVASPVTIIVDRTPPTVVTRIPAAGDDNVAVGGPIRAVFSEPIDPATITDASIEVTRDGAILGKTIDVTPDGRSITVSVVPGGDRPGVFTLAVRGTVKDLAGNRIAAPLSWSWTVPTWFHMDEVISSDPWVLLHAMARLPGDPDGAVIIVVEENGELQVRRWAGSWTTMGERLNVNSVSYATATTTVDAAGVPYVAWSEPIGTTNPLTAVFVKRWRGGVWDLVGGPLNADPGRSAHRAIVDVDTTGAPLVTWYENETATGDSYVVRVKRLTNPPSPAYPPRATAVPSSEYPNLLFSVVPDGGAGTPAVAITEPSGTSAAPKLIVKRWDGASWTAMGNALNENIVRGTVRMVVGAAGRPVAIFADLSPWTGAYRVLVREWNGTAWSQVGGPLNTPGTDVQHTIIAADGKGRIIAAWTEFVPGSLQRLRVMRWDGVEWTLLSNSLNRSATFPNMPAMAVDAHDRPVVAWAEQTDRREVRVVRLNE